MPKVKMLRDKMGSNDGATVSLYKQGETYDVTDSLAASFVGEKVAELVDGTDEAEKAEKAPANKALKAAPANKAE